MTSKTLTEWLDYQQCVHPRAIELGLGRVRDVWLRLGAPQPAPVVITIGGTNGKGSTVTFLEAMLGAAGKRVGAYTSPHLLRYNERVRVLGAEASDAVLIDAFVRIEAARENIALTYFEFGTLAALWIFAQSELDVALLEVGLGGRLDAVNVVDADAAIVTTVDLDHQDWLGNDIDSIAREKAGIFRRGRPAIIGMRKPPPGLLTEAVSRGADILRAGYDYAVQVPAPANRWYWRSGETTLDLPWPTLAAAGQVDNAASAIAALHALRDRVGWSPSAIARGVREAYVPARLQRLCKPGAPELVIDVAHNPQAARMLGAWLERNPQRTFAVFGALGDKDVAGITGPLDDLLEHWFLGGLAADTPRGLSAPELRSRMPEQAQASVHADVHAALDAARNAAGVADRILAFGSFFVAAAALQWAGANGYFTA